MERCIRQSPRFRALAVIEIFIIHLVKPSPMPLKCLNLKGMLKRLMVGIILFRVAKDNISLKIPQRQ